MANDLYDWKVILPRLLAATATGAALGIDRDIHHKPAGVRVLSMVSLGSAVAILIVERASAGQTDGVGRVIQGVLSGVGFLGAGVILHEISKSTSEVRGLTTAASVWVAAILGLAAGMGQWLIGSMTVVLAMGILTGGRRLEKYLQHLNPPANGNGVEKPKSAPH